MSATMKAAVFQGKGKIGIREVPRPEPGVGQALVKVTLTTICGTDVHILKGEYPVRAGLIVGHEPVGVIEALGPGVTGYARGDRVIVGAITPCGQCRACLSGDASQCGHGGAGYEAIGGWRFGNTIDGCQAEYVLVPTRRRTWRRFPTASRTKTSLLCPDIMSTGFSAAERGHVRLGDAVAVFAQGPIGLCATAGARLAGASLVIGVDSVPAAARVRAAHGRRRRAQLQGAGRRRRDQAAHRRRRRRRHRGARARRSTFENCLRSVRPGGTVSSLGVYSGHLHVPLDAFAAGLGDHTIVTSLCPGGKERMRRLMSIVAAKRFPFRDLVTHSFRLDDIEAAYDLFAHQRDGVMKVAIRP